MANYTTKDIMALREKTGAGMLDVKKALDEADGDQEKALEIIRVKGLKGIAKREGRSTSAGLVAAEIVDGGKAGVMVEVNSETDFVAKTDKFITIADKVLAQAVKIRTNDVAELLASKVEGGKTLQDEVDALQAIIGERLQVRRVAMVEGPHVELYLHYSSKDLPAQVGVLLATDEAGASVAHDVAMHIAAYSPAFLAREDVPAATVADERRIAEETAREEGKPEQALPKIVEGRLTGYFKENVLVDQAFAKDPKQSVAQVFETAKGKPLSFARFRVGA